MGQRQKHAAVCVGGAGRVFPVAGVESVALIQRPHPDIPETDRRRRIAMRLQLDGSRVVGLVFRLADIERFASKLGMVLHEHAIVEHRDESR